MALAKLTRNVTCTVAGSDVEEGRVRVRFAPIRGGAEIEDWLRFEPRGEPGAVRDVGRFIRILRAGRIRAPEDPYALGTDPERAADLLRRCQGTRLLLHLKRRLDRILTLWTENGVEKLDRVMDFEETPDTLLVRRAGGRSALHVARSQLIRYEIVSTERLEVVSLEPAPKK